ncbi:MAG: protoporphyrinogen oxidase [Simkaniaceae bacterium]|nr:protoporphyrinogen oxidase [Simkaniaceae bacterium]
MKKSVAVIGGGISGLSLAYLLQNHQSVTLFEKSDRLGGVMQTKENKDFLFEAGPRTFPFSRSQSLLQLLKELQLEGEVIRSDPSSEIRYLCCDGSLEKVPQLFKEIIRSPLTKGFTRAILLDLFAKRGPKDETIASFCHRHFGVQITQQWIDPIVKGVYAGDIEELSIVSAFPFLKEMEKEHRSILLANLFKKKKRDSTERGLFSLKGGVKRLIEALESRLLDIRKESFVSEIRFEEGRAHLCVNHEWHAFDHVYLTVEPQVAKKILPKAFETYFSHVKTVSLCSVNLGYYRQKNPFKGFGCLAPTKEKEFFLGIVFDSSIFPQQNKSEDELRLTVMIGGPYHASVRLSDEKLETISRYAVQKYLHIDTSPDLIQINRYDQAIVSCLPGHVEKMQELKRALASYPISLHGTYLSGASVNACIQASYAEMS